MTIHKILGALLALVASAAAAKHPSPNATACAPLHNTNASYFTGKHGDAVRFLELKDVCLDGDVIVVHDADILNELQAGESRNLPKYGSKMFQEFHRHARHTPDPLKPIYGNGCEHSDVKFRYPTTQEVKRSNPEHFSDCTIPVLTFGHWINTYAEFFTRAPAWFHQIQQSKALDRNITIILADCNRMPLLPYHRELLEPFSIHKVTSWSTFASRSDTASHSDSTAEGTHVRCFKKMLILGFDHASWAEAYNTGQTILAHYKAKGTIPDTKLFQSLDPSVLKLLIEYRAPEGEVHRLREPVKNLLPIPADDPRVVALIRDHPGQVLPPTEFADRPVYTDTRQILNIEEVMQQCKDADWAPVLVGTNWTGVECQAYAFGTNTFLEGMAVMQQTDLFVSMHGSGEINTMYMREGSMKLQLRAKDFGTPNTEASYMANGYWPLVCEQIASSRSAHPLQCWFANFEDNDSWEPGIFERLGLYGHNMALKARDRHLRLNFDHLKTLMKDMLPMQREKDSFSARWKNWTVATSFYGDGTKAYVKHKNVPDRRRRLSAGASQRGAFLAPEEEREPTVEEGHVQWQRALVRELGGRNE